MSFARLARPSNILLRASIVQISPLASIYRPKAMSTVLQNAPPVRGNLIDAIAKDHRDIFAAYDEFLKSSQAGDISAQGRWARQITWEIARHSISEELVVYPLFEKHLGQKGKAIADGDLADHQKVKEMLYKLEDFKPGTEEHATLLQNLMTTLKSHAQEEEQHDLPLLENAIGQDVSAKSEKSFQRTKAFVPTRSHPDAPNKPPFETLAGLMSAPMDKIKDMFSKFPSTEEKESIN